MLEFSNVSVTLKHRALLQSISFPVEDGRIVALLGRNGSGKTTLLRAAGRDVRYGGSITLDGTPIEALTPRERALRMAYLPQVLRAPAITVTELVSLGRLPHRSPLSRMSEEDLGAVHAAMEATGVLPLAKLPADRISGGERQRAYLAMALAQEAPLLLLDEPTTYLDADARCGFLGLLTRLVRDEGKAALCVLHDVNDAIRTADAIALLDGGRLAFFGSVASFIDGGLPEAFFGLTAHHTSDELPFYY